MKRSEFFNSRKGQIYLWKKRKISRLYVRINQEPKSKKSISNKEQLEFQEYVLDKLNKFRRRAYRSPVIVQIDFHSSKDNPPSIHNLAKNYLDLLENSIYIFNTRRRKLLYSDDRLIKILIVRYHVGDTSLAPRISIKIGSILNFMQDLELIDRIKWNHFENDDRHSSYLYDSYEFNELNDDDEEYDEGYDSNDLVNLERDKNRIINYFGEDVYNIMKTHMIQEIQQNLLKISGLKTDQLLMLFSSILNKQHMQYSHSDLFNKLIQESRDLIISRPFTIDLKHTPIQKGEKSYFKNNVRVVLNKFKEEYPILFPLRCLLSVTVLYVPPKNQGIDLDNLAKYIIPQINDIFKPPSTILHTINVDHVKDTDMKNRIKNMPRIPEHSVTMYQIIELPRFDDDPQEGFIRLIFGDGFEYYSLWDKVDKAIEKWENYIK